MRTVVTSIAASILIVMIVVTVWASRAIGLWDAWPDFRANPWAVATLLDAYSGFCCSVFSWRGASVRWLAAPCGSC